MITRVKGSVWRTEDNVGAVSIKDLGPQNTDITAPLTAALLAGNAIFIPIGQWLISGLTVPANALIYGMGERSILRQKDLANVTAMTVGSNTILRDFAIDGNKSNQVGTGFHAFLFTDAVDTQGYNLHAYNTKGCGYKISGINTSEVTLQSCATTGHAESGILVDSGGHVSLLAPRIGISDAIASGDGIAISSGGLVVSNIIIDSPVVRNQTGRGIALIGNGAKNVVNITLSNPRCENNVSHGVHLINADGVIIAGGNINTNGGDGVRIEGDVQNCRFVTMVCKTNTGFGMREIVLGSTPNFNGLIYGVVTGNGNNTITKVGVNSYIV